MLSDEKLHGTGDSTYTIIKLTDVASERSGKNYLSLWQFDVGLLR